jgi:6,7-dimethyl-8-ribityllumazine synthase
MAERGILFMAQSQNSSSLLSIETLRDLDNPRLAIVCTEWNGKIMEELLDGCRRITETLNASIVDTIIVPGSFELPFACKRIWEHHELMDAGKRPEAIIAFGAVIRGGTPHFEYVCKAVTEGITHLNLTLPVPVIFGVLTLDNDQQAWERLGGSHGHKGEEAAITALKMVRLCRSKGAAIM